MKGKTKEELKSIVNKDLILIITPSNCISIVVDNINNFYISYSVTASIDDIEYKGLSFDYVKAFILAESFTTLPTALFDETKIENYLNFTTSLKEEGIVKFDIVDSEKLVIVWELEIQLKSKLTQLFSGVTFQNIMFPFLNGAKTDLNMIQSLFLKDRLIVSVFKESKLELINCFDIKSIEDALYYHLLLLQSTELVESELTLTTGGNYKEMDEFTNKLEQYFSNIKSFNYIKPMDSEDQFVLELLKIVL